MKKKILALACVAALAACVFVLSACSNTKPASKNIKISDSKASVEQDEDGATILVVSGTMQNTGKKDVSMSELPQLTMDGVVVKAAYERTDNKPKTSLEADASAVYHVQVALDPSVEHEWKFVEAEDTAVEGLDQVECITEALRHS